MTEAQLYTEALYLLDKKSAPSFEVSDFNSIANDTIAQFIQKSYREYDLAQNITDDLRPLRKTVLYLSDKVVDRRNTQLSISHTKIDTLQGILYDLPDDYMHLTNCIVSLTDKKCKANSINPAKRLTSDMEGNIFSNFYLKPDRKRPFYFLTESDGIEILYGSKDETDLNSVSINYIRNPKTINLQPSQISPDSSDELEFSEITCRKILAELVKRKLELVQDPRLQTKPLIDQDVR